MQMYFMEPILRGKRVNKPLTEKPFLITSSISPFLHTSKRGAGGGNQPKSPRKYSALQFHLDNSQPGVRLLQSNPSKTNWEIDVYTKIRTQKKKIISGFFSVTMCCELTIHKANKQSKTKTRQQMNQRVSHPASDKICQDSNKQCFWSCATDAQHNLIKLYQRHISS